MEKQSQVGDETTSYKEYPPSEIYTTSDPPPAYIKPRHSSVVQVARIAAYTLVAVSFILGSFILASSYVTATLSCQEYQAYPQEYIEDRLPRFQGLVAEQMDAEETRHNRIDSADHLKGTEENKQDQEQQETKDEQKEQSVNQTEEENSDHEFKFKFPIHLDLDAITGALLEGNSKSKMNCVVEKQKSEELMNKEQKELITFGLDLASLDPGLKHITGERLAIVCETSRESPKEKEPNQIVLPFPLPLQAMAQRMMPHMVPHQVPNVMNHGPPQPPRGPFNMPFFRPNPFHNFMGRPQSQAPRRPIEEIPILVLEDSDSQLQNLMEIARPHQGLVEPLRQPHHIQNLIDLARGASFRHNLIEIPDKPVQLIQTHQEHRQIPPWARPEEQIVESQAVPTMGRPHMPRVNAEFRPVQVESTIQVEARPQMEVGRTMHVEGRVIPVEYRPIQMEPRPLQPGHHQGRSLPVPSDTVNPPPPPFDMQPEPSRPHFVQPRSIRSVENVFHRRDKRERRCACDCSC